jgi:outer membrane protein TolC/ABC-type uncharacterized transport system substrate-binding protein
VLLFLPTSLRAGQLPIVRIGIVFDGQWGRFPMQIEIFQQQIIDLTTGEFDVKFPVEKQIYGNWSIAGLKNALNQLFADPEVDLILILGFFVPHEVYQHKTLPKPIVFPFVIDAELQDLPLKNGTSGIKNLNYLAPFGIFKKDIKAFREIVPFSRITVLIDQLTLNGFPQLQEKMHEIVRKNNVSLTIVPVSSSAESALALLTTDTQAVYVMPLLRLSSHEFDLLTAGLIERRIPSFSLWGRHEVEKGLFMSVSPEFDMPRLARRTALNLQRILLGENAGSIEVDFSQGERLTINMATANAIGVYPNWSLLIEADIIHEKFKDIKRSLSLTSAVQEAISVNLDLMAANRAVAAGVHNIREARSLLLPQIEITNEGLIIDKDRARASAGVMAERTFSNSASLSQFLYSEKAWANFDIQRHIQSTREEERKTLRLDIAQDAAVAYLNVLKVKSFERIQIDNLKVTQSNLDLARNRLAIGFSGPSDVYRLESDIAIKRRSVINAKARLRQTEIALNRLLHRPIEEQFLTEEAGLDDTVLITNQSLFFSYLDNPKKFNILRDFMVNEGIDAAPELHSLNAAIAANERKVVSARRSFWSPIFSLQGNIIDAFSESGVGEDASSNTFSLDKSDDTDWNILFKLSFPLYTGGAKDASLKRAMEELSKLRFEHQGMLERVDANIRSTLYQAWASFLGIDLSKKAAESAHKNLDLVTDSYSRGVTKIIDLIDAQNASLVADLTAANTTYDFLIDLMRVQRAVGKYNFFLDIEERKAWLKRLESFFTEHIIIP